MKSTTRISAHISRSLMERLERCVRSSGVTRSHVIEQALAHHLRALDELPPDAIVPARLVLSRRSAGRVRERTEQPGPPTDSMRRLFEDR